MKRRLAYFSPLPPARTGIADYSQELLPHLARLAGVSLFSEQYTQPGEKHSHPGLDGLRIFGPAEYERRRWNYDLAIYHIGNSRHHEAIARTLLRYPGIMVLHDFGLHQLCAGRTVAVGDPAGYTREMAYSLGSPGIAWAEDALAGRRPLPHFEVPLNERFVDAALGLIVHSKYVEQLIHHRTPQQRVAVVPAPIAMQEAPSLRWRLGLVDEACIFGSFGLVSHTKQLEAALAAFRDVRKANRQCYYLIVGEWQDHDVDVPALVGSLGLEDAVRYVGYAATLDEFIGWLAAVDIVVNLRYPTVGETSAAALRALAAGRALVVYDHGWYAELPGDACLKLPPLDQGALVDGLRRLAEDQEFRNSLAERGQAYAEAHHTAEGAAKAYVDFVEQVLAGTGGSTR